MDARHELSVDPTRLLSGFDAPQRPQPYGAPPDASTLSYHSRYLASMPVGSTFPFLSGMFTGTLPGPPTSPFRAPSTPGVNNMRFWPPTPPPEGYGRYSMNTSLFPLFGAHSPDSGAFLSQGLVSRLGSTTHLSPVIDHKEHSFFTHGIGLGSPLTPTSHVTSPSPFPHLIPSLDRHPAYIGHMTLSSEDMEDLQQHESDDVRLMKSHMDCLMKHNIPSSRQDRLKSKSEGKLCCDKSADDCCKRLSPPCIPKSHDGHRSSKHHGRHQPTNKVHPCKIEVSHSPALMKPDLLSPPIDSPRPDTGSPCKKKRVGSPVPLVSSSPSAVTNHVNSNETRCSQCCATMKGVGLATKISTSGKDGVSRTTDSHVSKNCPVVTTMSMTHSDFMSSTVSMNHSQAATEHAESKQNNQKSPRTSPVILPDGGEKLQDQSPFKPRNVSETSKPANGSSVALKHVTAAVIPTAPKQIVHREIHPELNCSAVHKETVGCEPRVSEVSRFSPVNQDVKTELHDSSVHSEKAAFTVAAQSSSSSPLFTSNSPTVLSKPLVTNCKVKDMVHNGSAAKQLNGDKQQRISPFRNSEMDLSKTMPNSPVKSVPSTTSVSPTIMTKGPCQNAKVPPTTQSPVLKSEVVSSRMDCEFSQRSTSWSKATVLPYNWQNSGNQDDQAINLTVSKKPVKPEPSEALSLIVKEDTTYQSSVKFGSEGAFPNSGMIGVCHPNPSPVAVNKVKGTPAVSSISNFSAISVVNQPTEQSTEVHILHRSSKSSFPIVNRNTTPPVPLKSTISHVTANTSIRSVKAERLTTKRGKLGEVDKLGHNGRATLATLAPKISKTVGFGKDSQTSHTLSASSSVSSASIVFPATVNPCIPVGIAIAQQRQDSSSTTTGKSQSSVPSSTPNSMTPNQNLAASRVAVDLQAQELLADQKNQDISCSNNPTPVDTNLLVTQGPTIVSRQWESEALTRTAMPSASWLTHGSVVAPAVWLGQGAYAAPPTNPVPSIAMNPLEPSPISLPPGGYQLARDAISGHLLLIPTANIELMDRPSVWPTFNAPTGNLPIQQLVTQQQHTQFEQVLPHTETIKTDGIETCNITSCDISAQTKTEEKVEEISGQVPSVPLATGQTYAFTTFPTQCDPSTFSYVLQSSTVMHLAHTQTAASIQTESGRRSQGTSPLHCVTPSPPPNNCSVQVSVTEDEEESDGNESDDVACGEATEVRSCLSQSVTTAIQVDMDSQTNSEEDEEEDHKTLPEKTAETKVEMSDSANQTESVHSGSPKSEPEPEPIEMDLKVLEVIEDQPLSPDPPKPSEVELEVAEAIPSISIKEDLVSSEPGMEVVTSETELAPSLPVESKPVMDFIDHHGLNLLVDSIEEFASRGQEEAESVTDVTLPSSDSVESKASSQAEVTVSEAPTEEVVKEDNPADGADEKSYPSKYKVIDTSCIDSLGLLCALAEQRIFEEALNGESKTKPEEKQDLVKVEDNKKPKEDSVVKEQANSNDSFLSSSSSQDCEEASELDMRVRLAELQKKYRQKQRELELLRNKRERESSDDELESSPDSPQVTKLNPLNKNSPLSLSKPLSSFKEGKLSKSSMPRPWKKQKKNPVKDVNDNTKVKRSGFKKSKHISNKTEVKEDSSEEEEHAKVPSITLVHETSTAISGDSSNSGSSFSRGAYSKKESKVENYGSENSQESGSCISKDEGSSQDQNYDKNDKSKVPVFDEQAWFVRRSERIFLSDARSVPTASSDKSNKKSSSSSQKGCTDVSQKEKKEHVKPVKVTKNTEESDNKKVKNKSLIKPKTYLSKKLVLSDSNDSESSSDEASASDSENSDGASSTSDNLPLSTFVEHANSKATPERQKRLSVDSACSDISSGQSEDIPLSVLMGQKEENLPELKSCILKPAELQENARLLVLDEGLFYAGHVTKSEDPETFGILIDGDRAARPHMFTREEILNAAVLEVKPTHRQQLPEGSRICAFWSQQYRCLYPGTVTKASSPMPDPSMLHVEFDDGDSGRIPLNDIRMLPPDFPIVSMEPNPFMILGKRRSRAQSQNSSGTNDGKAGNDSVCQKQDKDKNELKKQKSSEKSSKRSHSEKCKDGQKRKRSPSTSNHSCSSDNPDQSIAEKKDAASLEEQPKNSDPTTSKDSDLKVTLTGEPKPKKHKKHKDDHHKHHHHHHHKHHHHKKHKQHDRNHGDAVISSAGSSPRGESTKGRTEQQDTFVLENSKSELTLTIKKSPSPHTNLEEAASAADKKIAVEASGSSSSEEDEEPLKKRAKKAKQDSQNKPAKRKERVPSVEKSKIAAFLPMRQLWRWSGKSYRRPGAKGKAKKEFFRAIQRGKESIKVGDCAVFLSTGRPHLPYIGRIETMWESWGGKMDVKVKWFYHPEETKSGKKLSQLKGALFQSPHFDENDVQTISHKCEVLSWDEYQQKKHHGSLLDNNDTYFLAGTYDPILGTLILEPGVPNIPSNNAQDL